MAKEKRGGHAGYKNVVEQRKWRGVGGQSHRTWSSQMPVPGSTPQGRLAVAVGLQWYGYSSLIPGRRDNGRQAKRKGCPSFLRVPDQSSLHQRASGHFALTSSSACLQACPSVSAVSSHCSHSGTEEAKGHDRQVLARGERLRQESRLEGEVDHLVGTVRSINQREEGLRGLGEREGEQERGSTVTPELEQMGLSIGGSLSWS